MRARLLNAWRTALFVAGFGLLILLSRNLSLRDGLLILLVYIPLIGGLQHFAFPLPGGLYHSFESAVCLAGSLLLGPVAAAWAVGVSTTLNSMFVLRRKLPVSLRAGGMVVLMWLAGGYTYQALGGVVPLSQLGLLELGRVLALIGVVAVVNRAILILDQWFSGQPARKYLTQVAPLTFLLDLMMVPVGATMAVAYTRIGWLAASLLLIPLFMVSVFYRQLTRASEMLRKRVAALDALNRAGRSIGASLEVEPLLELIHRSATQLIDTSNFWIATYDEERRELTHEIIYDEGVRYPPTRRPYDPSQGVTAWIIEHRQPLLVGTLAELQETGIPVLPMASGRPSESLLGVPMMAKGKVVGVICVQSYTPHAFSLEDADVLMTLANQAAVAIENARLFRQVEQGRRELRTVLDSVDHPLVVTDLEGHILLANRAMEGLFGIPEKEALGHPLGEVIAHRALADIARRIAAAEIGGPERLRVDLSDGRVMIADLTPLTTSEGERTGYVMGMADVTALHELNQLKTRMMRMASHDLRNPLHLASGFFDILVESLSPLPEHQANLAQRVTRHLGAMEQLIDDLLDLERVEGASVTHWEMLDLRPLIQEVVHDQYLPAELKHHRLSSDIQEELPLVEGNAHLLRRALTNLLDNAIKYTPPGGSVAMRAYTEGDMVVIAVQDSGIGIPSENQQHIFDDFYRVQRPETTGVPGTGLGLSLVKMIAEQHGGRVWVESSGIPGQGTTFRLALPIWKGAS